MSSTRKRKRGGVDNYPTPKWAVERFLEKWSGITRLQLHRWIEPAVGEGAIVKAVQEYRPDIEWTCIDVRDVRPALRGLIDNAKVCIADFLAWKPRERWHVAIMNPPFMLTEAFIRRCFELASTVVCFQTLNLLGSEDRNEWMVENVPDVYVLPNRVSHSGDGKADSVYSAWYVWPDTAQPRSRGEIVVLDNTPLDERKEQELAVRRMWDGRALMIESLFLEDQ